MISAYANDSGSNWCSLLAPTTFAYNCSIHRVTGRSPFQMLFGREPCLPIDLRTKLFQEEQIQESEDGGRSREAVRQEAEANLQRQSETMKQLREAWKLVRAAIEEKTAIRDAYRDEKVGAKQHDFREGELVLRKLAHERMEHKFAARYEGPYRIVSIQKPNAFIKKLHEEGTPTKVHFDLLKPFKEAVSLPHYATEAGRPEETEGTIATVGEDPRGREEASRRGAIAAAKKAGILALKEAARQSYRPVTEEILKVYEGLVAVNIHADEKMFEEPRTDLEVYVAVSIDIIAREADTPETADEEADDEQRNRPTIAVLNGTDAFSEETYYKTHFGKQDEKQQEEERQTERTTQETTQGNDKQASPLGQRCTNVGHQEISEWQHALLANDGDKARAAEELVYQQAKKKATDVARPECRSQADERCIAGAERPECRGQADVHHLDTSSSYSNVEMSQRNTEVKRPESRGRADESRTNADLGRPKQGSASISNRDAEVFLTREDTETAEHHHRARYAEPCRQPAEVTTYDAPSGDDHSNNARGDLSNNASIREKVDDQRSKS